LASAEVNVVAAGLLLAQHHSDSIL